MSSILAVTYDGAVAVTPSGTTNDPAGPFAGLLVTTAGTLSFVDVRGNTIVMTMPVVGQIIPIACKRVNTGNAAVVLGLYAMPFKGTNPAAQ